MTNDQNWPGRLLHPDGKRHFSFCPPRRNIAVHTTDTTRRMHVDRVHPKEMPTIKLAKATDVDRAPPKQMPTIKLAKATAPCAMEHGEQPSANTAPTKKRRRSDGGTSNLATATMTTIPVIPSHSQLRSHWTLPQQLIAIRRLLFLEEEHDATFHQLAKVHLRQTLSSAPFPDNQQLSLDAAISFLRIFDTQLWPTSPDQRTHLLTVSTRRNSRFWRRGSQDPENSLYGPYFALDSVMPSRVRSVWRTTHGLENGEPTKADELGSSKLGELMKIYFTIILVLKGSEMAQSEIMISPNKLMEKIVGGGNMSAEPQKQNPQASLLVRLPVRITTESTSPAPASLLVRLPVRISTRSSRLMEKVVDGGSSPTAPVKRNPRASLVVRLPVGVTTRSSSPDIPLSTIIDDWRSTREAEQPPSKRLKVPEPKPRRTRPPVGKIITSPRPPSSLRAETKSIPYGTLARVQALQHADTTRMGVQRSPLFPYGAGPHSQPPRMEITSQPVSISAAVRQHVEAQMPPPPRQPLRRSFPEFVPARQTTHVRPHPFLQPAQPTLASSNMQLPTPTSATQSPPIGSSFEEALERHIAQKRSSLPSSFDMPPPARPWPTMPAPYVGYEVPHMAVGREIPACGYEM